MTWRVFVADGSRVSAISEELGAQSVAHSIVDVAGGIGPAVAGELRAGFTRIAVAGNDAIVAEAVESVLEEGLEGKIDLAILPGGTKSDLLRTFALDQALGAAVRRMSHGNPYAIDVGVAEGTFGKVVFMNSVATGVLAGGPAWFPIWPRPLRAAGPVLITAGTRPVETMASGILVLNGQFWGDWVGAPRSTLVDGVVDLEVFTGPRRILARLRRAFRSGNHVRGAGVRRLSVAHAVIDQPAGWIVTVDGVRLGRGSFTVAVIPGALRLSI